MKDPGWLTPQEQRAWRAHLAAHRLLSHLRDHAPEEHRETMIENVPLNRDIHRARAAR